MILQVAYQGVPEKAYEVFVHAVHSSCLRQGFDIPPLEDQNPAGMLHVAVHVHNGKLVKVVQKIVEMRVQKIKQL